MSGHLSRVAAPVKNICRSLLVRCMSTRVMEIPQEADGISPLKQLTDIPGPSGVYDLPYIGPAFHFKPFTKYTVEDVHELFGSFRDKYGDILKFNSGAEKTVLVFDPDYAKEILSIFDKYPFRPKLELLTAYYQRKNREPGLGVLQGEAWNSLRKPAQQHMLRPIAVSNYIPMISEVTNDFITSLSKESQIDDCLSRMFDYTTESVGMLCFNRRLGCLDGTSDIDIKTALQTFFQLLPENGNFLKLYRYFRTPLYNTFENAADTVYGLADREVVKTKQILQSHEKDGNLEEILGSTPHLIYHLLGDGSLTPEQVGVMIVDLFAGGVDSTSNAITILLHELSVNQDKQEKLHIEIENNIGKGEITKEALNNMPYLKACVKESMRKNYPVHIGLAREFDKDITVGDYHIPKGTKVIPVLQLITRDERFFEQPDKFMPERFLRVNKEGKKNQKNISFTFLPFGFGPRSCIGQRFAESEIFIAVTKMIQNFRITVPPGSEELPITYKLFATPARKVTLNLEKRN